MRVTEREICGSFRRAENQKQQIQILTELTCKSKYQIIGILLRNGEKVPKSIEKFDYYMAAYDDDLILIAAKGKKDIRITGAAAGASFEDIQSQLIDEKASSGWKEQIADAVDRVVDKMLKETPPETEEERQNCETMRETIKGMFLTQRRSKTEAAFITENIDRYEELFEICMNGDDAQFKKGITELQKAQNEYILQKERENG